MNVGVRYKTRAHEGRLGLVPWFIHVRAQCGQVASQVTACLSEPHWRLAVGRCTADASGVLRLGERAQVEKWDLRLEKDLELSRPQLRPRSARRRRFRRPRLLPSTRAMLMPRQRLVLLHRHRP